MGSERAGGQRSDATRRPGPCCAWPPWPTRAARRPAPGPCPRPASREASEPSTESTDAHRRASGARLMPAEVVVGQVPQLDAARTRTRARTRRRPRGRPGTARPRGPATRRRRWPARSPAARATASRSVSKASVAIIPVNAGSSTSSGVDGVEHRLLVLLEVAVVGQRQALERASSSPARSPTSRPALPRASSATSGFFFCGMIYDPVRVGVVERRRSRTPRSPRGRPPRRAARGRPPSSPARSANSATKSRSRCRRSSCSTARSKPRSRATASGSRPSEEPASAPEP